MNKKVTSIQDLHDLYDFFNQKYFSNELPNHFPIRFFTPRSNGRMWGFVTHISTRAGHPTPRFDVTDLQISNELIEDQKALKRTMLHEMIHVYQAEVKRQNPTHRKLFQAWCRHLTHLTNKQYGVIS